MLQARERISTFFFDIFTFELAFVSYKKFKGASHEIGTLATLQAHNFLCIPLIEVR
jgi:hypothetical protein